MPVTDIETRKTDLEAEEFKVIASCETLRSEIDAKRAVLGALEARHASIVNALFGVQEALDAHEGKDSDLIAKG